MHLLYSLRQIPFRLPSKQLNFLSGQVFLLFIYLFIYFKNAYKVFISGNKVRLNDRPIKYTLYDDAIWENPPHGDDDVLSFI